MDLAENHCYRRRALKWNINKSKQRCVCFDHCNWLSPELLTDVECVFMSFHSFKMSKSLCDWAHLQVTEVLSMLGEGLRKGEVAWSQVWKGLAGQQEPEQPLWTVRGWVYQDLLTNCQIADVSLAVGAPGVTLGLSGCVCVAVWAYVFEWVGVGQWHITHQQVLPPLHLFVA